jgi:hypothetical protein
VAAIAAKTTALDVDYMTRWLRVFEADAQRPLEEELRRLLRRPRDG